MRNTKIKKNMQPTWVKASLLPKTNVVHPLDDTTSKYRVYTILNPVPLVSVQSIQ